MSKTLPLLAYVLSSQLSAAALVELYSTDFNNFPLGPDDFILEATEGWVGNNKGDGVVEKGVHGIDELVATLDRSVYLGGVLPDFSPALISRPIAYDPVGEGTPVVEVDLIIGIQDSSTLRKDKFEIAFYNNALLFLGAIGFDNSDLTFGVYRLNDATITYTGDTFIRNEIMFLTLTIDFSANTWSASLSTDLSEIPIFVDATFNATGQDLDLGYFAAQWRVSAVDLANFGNNFMLLDELSISALSDDPPVPVEPFTIDSVANADGSTTLTWFGQAGFTYQVEFSPDLTNWSSALPDSSKSAGAADTTLSYTDTSAPAGTRYYRVTRAVAN